MSTKKLLFNIFIMAVIIAAIYCIFILIKDSNKKASVVRDSVSVSNNNGAGENRSIQYTNNTYGFIFALPGSWKGYTIFEMEWEGYAIARFPTHSQELAAKGPELLIRHPLWSKSNRRQDIPILIFDLSQWQDMRQDKFHIGAAPINPSELGRNNKYVFALPARYNYAFPEGYEEVENILSGNPLVPFDI